MSDPTTVRRIDRLMQLLVDNATFYVSGEKIAREIGVTRSSVWHWVEKLRAMGCEISANHATGYRLKKIPDLLVPQLLKRGLSTESIGKNVHHFFEIDSTNNYAMKIAFEGAPHGTLVLSEAQTAGRGRFTRTWYSEPRTGIYASLILRPNIPPARAPLLTLLTAIAVYESVTLLTHVSPDVRWPNDLLIGGKKVCGILTEMHAEMSQIQFIVIGIGLNVNQPKFPLELERIATSLRIETKKSWSRVELLTVLLKRLENRYVEFLKMGAEAVIRRWSEISSFARGKRVEVDTGFEKFRGVTAGLDRNGFLLVNKEDGETELVVSGDVYEISASTMRTMTQEEEQA